MFKVFRFRFSLLAIVGVLTIVGGNVFAEEITTSEILELSHARCDMLKVNDTLYRSKCLGNIAADQNHIAICDLSNKWDSKAWGEWMGKTKKDVCLAQYAKIMLSPNICDQLSTERSQEECIKYVQRYSESNNFYKDSGCHSITNAFQKYRCLSRDPLYTPSGTEGCQQYTDPEHQIRCIITTGKGSQNCSIVADSTHRDFCITQIAFHNRDESICNEINASKFKRECKKRLLNAESYKYHYRTTDLTCFGLSSASKQFDCPKYFARAYREPSICEFAQNSRSAILRCQAAVVGSIEWYKVIFSLFSIPLSIIVFCLLTLYKITPSRKDFLINSGAVILASLLSRMVQRMAYYVIGYYAAYLDYPTILVNHPSQLLLRAFTTFALHRPETEFLYLTYWQAARFSSLFLIFTLGAIAIQRIRKWKTHG